MREAVRWVMKAGTAGAISLAILSAVTLVYFYSGVHITNETGATDYRWEPNQFRSNMAEGFSRIRMNSDGFNNPFDLKDADRVDILLMGSSHMEAANVAGNKNAGYLLNKNIPGLRTYNIGISGHTIYHCVDNLEDAVFYYRPERYIIIETDRVELDEGQMEKVLEGTLEQIPSHDSGPVYRVQKSIPCIQLLYREIGNWMSASASAPEKMENDIFEGEEIQSQHGDSYDILLDSFIKRISDAAGEREVIIFFHPDTAIDREGRFKAEEGMEDVLAFERACSAYGITFIDMYDDFKELYESKHKFPYGFANTAPGYGHLNADGHGLVAERLADVIKENGTE